MMTADRIVVEIIAGFIIALVVTVSGRKPKPTPIHVDCYCQVCPAPLASPTPDPCADVRAENDELRRRIQVLEDGRGHDR